MTIDNPTEPSRIPYAVSPRIRWGLLDCVMVVAVFLTVALVAGLTGTLGMDAQLHGFLASLLGYAAIGGVVLYATMRRGRRSLREDFRLAFRPFDLVIGIGVGLGMRLLLSVVAGIVAAVAGHQPTAGNYTVPTEPLWLVLDGLLIATLLGPFVEELVLRGLVLQSVRNVVLRWRNRPQPAEPAQQRRAMWISIIVSAVVFAALHLGQSADPVVVVVLGIGTLALGVINAAFVYAFDRLGPGIVTHMVFNGSAILVAIVVPS